MRSLLVLSVALMNNALADDVISVSCTNRGSSAVTGIGVKTSVSCESGETLVSCGIIGTQGIGGAWIESSDPSTCWALSNYNGFNVVARAVCCTFPEGVVSSVTTVKSETDGTSVSASCGSDSVLTGCHVLYATGSYDYIRGTWSGPTTTPPQQTAWIDTENRCNAETKSGSTAYAVAQCLTLSSGYELDCVTKAKYTNYANYGTCDTGYNMFSCNTWTNSLTLDSYYVNDAKQCYVQQDNHAQQYANAICCQLVQTLVDECAEGLDDCDENASCYDLVDGYQCVCNAGYSGDGVTCTDIDECAEGLANCDVNAQCINTLGGFECVCNDGFSGDGLECIDIDECSSGLDDCSSRGVWNAKCVNAEGSYSCQCISSMEVRIDCNDDNLIETCTYNRATGKELCQCLATTSSTAIPIEWSWIIFVSIVLIISLVFNLNSICKKQQRGYISVKQVDNDFEAEAINA